MEQHISSESLQLIANLIKDKNADLKEHFDVQLRMIKTTVQENHNLAIETRDLQKITNGRVNMLENEMYGFVDKNNSRIKGREGLLFKINEVEKWKWVYKNWKVPLAIFLFTTAIYVKESRDFMIKLMDKIF